MKVCKLAVLVLAGILFTGCASVHEIGTGETAVPSYDKINKTVRGKVARLTFRSGAEVPVVSLYIAGDSASWVDPQANRLKSVPLSDLREISVVKAGRGAFAGLVVGTVIGAGFGAVRALMQGDDPIDEFPRADLEEKLRVYPVAHAAYASLGTTIIGAAIGRRVSFRFDVAPGQVAERR